LQVIVERRSAAPVAGGEEVAVLGESSLLDEDEDFNWESEPEVDEEIESSIDPEDAESHYNLGIAYKEMGLLDDAITEFATAMRHPSRRFDALTLKGICLAEKGAIVEAEEALRLGLKFPGLGQEEKMSLHFELGLIKENAGHLKDALQQFQAVAETDHFFRDVGLKIKKLKDQLGITDTGLDNPSGLGNKNKVTYL